jgi:antitoxin component of RelBE/YafQ-DinJ toxin-antitoxin module
MANTPQLNIRVEQELKEAFIAKAKENGTTATELLIGFMQQYLGIEPKKPVAGIASLEVDSRLADLEERLSKRIAELEEVQRGKPQRAA